MSAGFWTPRTRWLIALFVFALLLRLGYCFTVRNGPLGNGDSFAYQDLAQKLLTHQPYFTLGNAGPGGFPSDLQRPPGYPAFLAVVQSLLGSGRFGVAIVQCLLSAGFAVLLAVLVSAFSTDLAGLIAGALYAVDWVTIVHAPMTIAETLFAVLLGAAICVYALGMARRSGTLALAAGFLLGTAALVKPIAQVVVLAFLLGWLLQKQRRAAGLLFLLSYMACVGPWMMRNYRQHGLATLSAVGTVDLYFYVAEASAHPASATDLAGSGLNDEVTRESNQWASRQLSAADRKRDMEHETWPLIAQHWPTVAYKAAIGFARTSLGTGSITAANSLPSPPGRTARILLAAVPMLQILILWSVAVVGVFRTGDGRVTVAVRAMLVACVVLLVIPASASLGQSRFRVPAVPVLAVLGGIGGASLLEARRASSKGQVAV